MERGQQAAAAEDQIGLCLSYRLIIFIERCNQGKRSGAIVADIAGFDDDPVGPIG